MTPDDIASHFTRPDGTYCFARWGRPLAPVVFGVDDTTLAIVNGAVQTVVALADHSMAETDPELGSNLMLFFVRNWDELTETPGLDRLIPELEPLVDRLNAAGANQYRLFRFDADGAIRAVFVFVCMDDALSAVPAWTLALGQIVQTILLWSDQAFADTSPLAQPGGGQAIVHPDIAALIRAAYDPVLPKSADDPAHALRLLARMEPA